ncbi:MAG: hypothetical protein ACXWFY_05490 [Chthoniobacterales bacterium]
MKTKLSSLAAALILACVLATSATAQSPAIQGFTGGVNLGLSGFTVGWSFTANQNLSVTALGWKFGNALGEPVGIWTGDGSTLLGQVTVTGAFSVGSFAYNNLTTPIFLSAGQTYLIGGLMNSGSAGIAGATSVTTNPFVTYIQGGQSVITGVLSAPISGAPPNSWFGPNFLAIGLPEQSSTLPLLSLGVLSLLLCQRKLRMARRES